jgi:hypothetical protein
MSEGIDYDFIRALSKRLGRPMTTLLALSDDNDPLFATRDSRRRAAEWFADLYKRLRFGAGVHIRRVHYKLLSQEAPIVDVKSVSFRPATMLSWVGAAGMLGLQCGGDAGRYDQADDRGDRPGAASGGSVGAVPGGSSACRVKFKMLSSFQDDQQNRGFFDSLISRKKSNVGSAHAAGTYPRRVHPANLAGAAGAVRRARQVPSCARG